MKRFCNEIIVCLLVVVKRHVCKHIRNAAIVIPLLCNLVSKGHEGGLWQRICALKLLFVGQLFQPLLIDLSTAASSHPSKHFPSFAVRWPQRCSKRNNYTMTAGLHSLLAQFDFRPFKWHAFVIEPLVLVTAVAKVLKLDRITFRNRNILSDGWPWERCWVEYSYLTGTISAGCRNVHGEENHGLSICGSTALCWPLAAFSVSWSFYTVGRTLLPGDQPVTRPLPTHRTAQTQNKRTQTSMRQVGFEPTIPVFERAKTVHALDSAATVIGIHGLYSSLNIVSVVISKRATQNLYR
jgi:hypothetical protein